MPSSVSGKTCPLCCSSGIIRHNKTELTIHTKHMEVSKEKISIPGLFEETEIYFYECMYCNPPRKYFDISNRATIKQDLRKVKIQPSVVRAFAIEKKRRKIGKVNEDSINDEISEANRKLIFKKIKGAVRIIDKKKEFVDIIEQFKNKFRNDKISVVAKYTISVRYCGTTMLVDIEKRKKGDEEEIIAIDGGYP